MVYGRVKESRFHDIYLPVRRDLKVVLWSPHAGAPRREFYTGTIVRELHRRLGTAGIVAEVSRVIADLNRPADYAGVDCSCPENYQREAVEDFFNQLKEIFRELEVLGEDGKVREKTLLLGIHGVKDEIGYGMILGTRHGILCPTELRGRIKRKLELLLEAAEIDLNQNPIGCEVSGYQGHPFLEEVREKFGEKLNIVQLEISKTLRTRYTDQVITALSMVALTLR